MSHHRRYAGDFTDSLNSFQYNTSSELDFCMISSFSEDSLNEVEGRNDISNASRHNCNHSTILDDNFETDCTLSNASISSTTFTPLVPDLNKRIDLFKSGNSREPLNNDITDLYNKSKDNKENNNPQCAMKNIQLENRTPKRLISELTSTATKQDVSELHNKLKCNIINEVSKRDSNYNIHNNKFDVVPVAEENKDIHTNGIIHFETILSSLDNQLNQMKEVSQPEQLLKRLSNEYVHCPKNFTEKLLTIIEESIINNGDASNASAINLSRLTTEFRKMCKFIEDESSPDWPSSVMTTPPYPNQVDAIPECNKFESTNSSKTEHLLTASMGTPCIPPTTPLSAISVIKRRFFQKMSKHNSVGSIDNLINTSSNVSSNDSFERLEAQCKRLFPEEKECPQPLQKSLSVPSLLSMTEVENMCEQQMASLSISNTSDTEKSIRSTPNLLDSRLHQSPLIKKFNTEKELSFPKLQQELYHESTNFGHDVSYSKKKSIKINRKSEDPDELEQTLLQDIAKKRKRCLDTARLIKKINADTKIRLEENDNKSDSLSSDEAKFLKTLISCKDYQTYLEKRKPLFHFLRNPCLPETTVKNNTSTDSEYKVKIPDIKVLNATMSPRAEKNTLSSNIASCICKSPLSRNRNQETKEKKKCSQTKFFLTPGKTPPNKYCKKKKIYFPSMYSPIKDTKEKNIESSASQGHRKNLNTVVSPVGMYIRGTDMQLIKNVRARKGGLLFTPVKMNDTASPSRNSRQTILSKSLTKPQGQTSLKINLSPKFRRNQSYKQEITSTACETDSAHKNDFVLPRVSYKLPLQVKTIKEIKSPKSGARVKKLLESMESKVVIRHEGRINSIWKQRNAGMVTNNEIVEINYEPEDESIHIEQAASKTNFLHKQRYV
ncbi:uncharacterized protein LOC128887471 isoform X1 [Hylaeus anthracinus]|uniref:uncharacterized protein LOC128887471 isoform X1 n=1 Tax=Hylaeus anthracinus TaxID=313031 RepID=UPI0023B8F661|nr:uncharacterized protein LOC128887471 isoform X1 [Hylaeus anthracinus]